jgi:hypothetical protein
LVIPFADVKEADVIGWIDTEASVPVTYTDPDGTMHTDSTHRVTGRLQEQLDTLTAQKKAKVIPPWLPQTFTVGGA